LFSWHKGYEERPLSNDNKHAVTLLSQRVHNLELLKNSNSLLLLPSTPSTHRSDFPAFSLEKCKLNLEFKLGNP